MKELTGTARNVYLAETDDGFVPYVEAVFIVSEPLFTVDVTGDLLRSRQMETLRFVTNAKGLRNIAKQCNAWADEAEELLQSVKAGTAEIGGEPASSGGQSATP